jgi:hypothetical protein
MNAFRLTIVPVALAFSACAMLPRFTSVYYVSTPSGGQIVQGGEVIGHTPLRKQYRISDKRSLPSGIAVRRRSPQQLCQLPRYLFVSDP